MCRSKSILNFLLFKRKFVSIGDVNQTKNNCIQFASTLWDNCIDKNLKKFRHNLFRSLFINLTIVLHLCLISWSMKLCWSYRKYTICLLQLFKERLHFISLHSEVKFLLLKSRILAKISIYLNTIATHLLSIGQDRISFYITQWYSTIYWISRFIFNNKYQSSQLWKYN